MILSINKKIKDNKGRSLIWYDPFFQESVTLECDGYTIKTKYSPYCILNDKPIKIDKAIDIFKKHNNINYDDVHVLNMMKSLGLVQYEYIQEPEIHNYPKNKKLSPDDNRKLTLLLDNYSINYTILNQNSEGIRIEIEEKEDEEEEKNLEDFLLEITRDYEYKES